jgi:DNA-binding MarR family transcriptional regulator
MLRALGAMARKFSTRTVLLHQVIAQSAGLNATDTRCLELMLGHPTGVVTAGWLAEQSGLTSGAVTHILDRLEKHGYVERVRDEHDRRRVFIRLRQENVEKLLPRYEEIGRAYGKMVGHYSDEELRLIFDYMERMSAMSERLMADVVAARREDAG